MDSANVCAGAVAAEATVDADLLVVVHVAAEQRGDAIADPCVADAPAALAECTRPVALQHEREAVRAVAATDVGVERRVEEGQASGRDGGGEEGTACSARS